MKATRTAAAVVFVGAAIVGSMLDRGGVRTPPVAPAVLAGDFHVHGMPGDGALPVWEIQREAARRGLDVVAITNHNDNLSFRLAEISGRLKPYPIVIPGQELTTAGFHIAAIGVRTMVSPYVPARDAIAMIQAQGGVAIAAHPVRKSWLENDDEALRLLDGSEVAHPLSLTHPRQAAQLVEFHARVRRVNPDIAPIGSTDFHLGIPLGVCRTYLIVDEVSESGALDAIRRGRTVASVPGGGLIGDDQHVRMVQAHLRPPQSTNFRSPATWPALLAIVSLGFFVVRP